MAVLNKKKSKVSGEVPMSSTADIAFLLLIFFLVTTVFPKDKGLAIVLPEQSEEVQEIEALWRDGVAQNPNLIAAVKTHPDAPYKFMVDVLDALHQANAERISLQLLEG
jgi:biopolymer transport protein ExbD